MNLGGNGVPRLLHTAISETSPQLDLNLRVVFFTLWPFSLGFTMGQNQQAQSTSEEELEVSTIQDLYRRFINECPSGSLHLHEFKRMFGVQNDNSPESQYMEGIFSAFDMNGVRFWIQTSRPGSTAFAFTVNYVCTYCKKNMLYWCRPKVIIDPFPSTQVF